MYFGEVFILSRYGCQEGINLLVQHPVSRQGHSSSHTDMQRALTSCLNHLGISEGCQWPSWQMKRGSPAPRQQSNVRGVITKEGFGGRISAVYQLMMLQGVFFSFQKVNLFILSVHRIRSARVQGRVVMVRAVGWVMGGIGKSRFLMRDLMAFQDDEIIKVLLSLDSSPSPLQFSSSLCLFIIYLKNLLNSLKICV